MSPFVLLGDETDSVINTTCEGGPGQGSRQGAGVGWALASGWTAQGSPVVLGGGNGLHLLRSWQIKPQQQQSKGFAFWCDAGQMPTSLLNVPPTSLYVQMAICGWIIYNKTSYALCRTDLNYKLASLGSLGGLCGDRLERLNCGWVSVSEVEMRWLAWSHLHGQDTVSGGGPRAQAPWLSWASSVCVSSGQTSLGTSVIVSAGHSFLPPRAGRRSHSQKYRASPWARDFPRRCMLPPAGRVPGGEALGSWRMLGQWSGFRALGCLNLVEDSGSGKKRADTWGSWRKRH